MENNKNTRRVIKHNFSEHPELALQFLKDEKKARDEMRRREEKGQEVELPQYVKDIMDEVA
jgi:hypothetical protein